MKKIFIYCDGGARGNPGPAGIGFLVKNEQGEILTKQGLSIGRATNNYAEYQAVIKALEWLINFSRGTIFNFYLDSLLVVQQLKGIYKVKNDKLRLLHFQIKKLEIKLGRPIIYQQIPREENEEADRLVNSALNKALKLN